MRTLPFNVTGHPALSVPAGFVAGLPVGLQIVGPAGAEALICRIGARLRALDRPRGAAPAGGPPVFGQMPKSGEAPRRESSADP